MQLHSPHAPGSPMKAMILAAGLGTRLRPLTDTRPKALVEVGGRTLLEITLTRLRSFGITEVIVNVHHFADMVVDYLKSHDNFGMRIEISREDELLLDTGGGLKKAGWFFLKKNGEYPSEPFLLHNVDVISSIDFRRMLEFHNEHQALATLAVQSRESSRLLLFNEQLQLCGRRIYKQEVASDEWRVASLKKEQIHALGFSGIHIVSPRLLPMLSETGVFSIIDAYLRLAAQGEKIFAFRADEYYWRDLGRPGDLQQAALDLQKKDL
jgi:NDP-sugar pyrophosphorylase family protein